MFTHMTQVRREKHSAHGNEYELLVYQVQETNEYRIYVSKKGFGVGDIFTASQEVIEDAKKLSGEDVIAHLIKIAKSDIDRNEFDRY